MAADAATVAAALRRIVRDHGRRVVEDPTRVRALLADAVGPSARELRAEIDAVVVAAEEGVGTALGDGVAGEDVTADDTRRSLEDRGLAPAMAALAVDAWRSALAGDGSATTAGAGATATATGSSDSPGTGSAGPSVGGPTSAGRRSVGHVEATELPMPAEPGTGSPGHVHAGSARGEGPSRPTPDTATTAPTPAGTSHPRALTLSRGWTIAAGATSLAVAFSLGLLGSGPLGIGDRSATLTAGERTPLPGTTPSTSTVTVTSVETTSVTTSVTKTVTKTVTQDSAKLKAVNQTDAFQPVVVWAGNTTCSLKPPPKATQIRPCSRYFTITSTGSVKSWKIVSAKVSQGGDVTFSAKQIYYYYTANGAYNATITFVIAGGGVQSTGTVKMAVACNRNLTCGMALPQ